MAKKIFPGIDPNLLGEERETPEPKIVLWAGGKPKLAQAGVAGSPGASATRAPAVVGAAKRRLNPANVLLPAARSWAQALPPEIVPQALMAAYPRITNRIALDWREPAQCRAYLSELLVDRRGGRRGFPKDVRDDIVKLRDYYDGKRPQGAEPRR